MTGVRNFSCHNIHVYFRRFAPLGIRGGRLAQLAGFGLLHRSCWHRTTGVQAPGGGGGGGGELQALGGGGVGGGLHQAPAAAARSSQANLASFSPPHLSQTCSHLFSRKLVIWHLAPGTWHRYQAGGVLWSFGEHANFSFTNPIYSL